MLAHGLIVREDTLHRDFGRGWEEAVGSPSALEDRGLGGVGRVGEGRGALSAGERGEEQKSEGDSEMFHRVREFFTTTATKEHEVNSFGFPLCTVVDFVVIGFG
ncbi:MAG: hypothetical protein CVU44_16830 [Chloroflexi bacterium HGW-Chloroflexi-6]|nr:MAG: hypothetical protein CVU44_16830 [Chloroflexi bacterium HGW-Chloroflexi-6]